MDMAITDEPVGWRGPVRHEMRERIVGAAEARFRHYGYGKTTVADIAEDLKVSTAYIYKFFDSKTAICEAVCGATLDRIDEALWAVARADAPASDRLLRLYEVMLDRSVALLFNERKLHDMVLTAMDHRWQTVERHKQAMRDTAGRIISDGRAAGDFETETPLEEQVSAVWSTLVPFAHPAALEHAIELIDLSAHARFVARLALRGLQKR